MVNSSVTRGRRGGRSRRSLRVSNRCQVAMENLDNLDNNGLRNLPIHHPNFAPFGAKRPLLYLFFFT